MLTASRRVIGREEAERIYRELYGEDEWETGVWQDADAGDGEGQDGTCPQPESAAYPLSTRRTQLLRALAENDNSRSRTAEALGISKATLWRWMKKYGIAQKDETKMNKN